MYRLTHSFWLLLLATLVPLGVSAATLTLPRAEQIALAQDLGLQADSEQSLALREEATFAGQLPDPQLILSSANLPVDTWDIDQEPMTQLKVGVRQQFPAGDTRALRQQKMVAQSDQVEAERGDAALQLRQQIRQHWFALAGWSRSRQLLRDYRPVFEQLVEVTLSFYKTGRKHQQDYLRAKLLLGQLDNRLLAADRQLAVERAWLSRWLGDAAYGELDSQWPEHWLAPVAGPVASGHPRLLASDYRVRQQAAQLDIAGERYKPNWGLEMSYARREAEDMAGDRLPDFFSAAITVDLPLFTANRQDRQYRAEKHRLEAMRISRADLLAEMNASLVSGLAQVRELQRSLALYREQLLALGERQADAALQAYRSDAADFADVMQSSSVRLELELDYQQTLQRYYQSLAGVYYLLPEQSPTEEGSRYE
ncbi:TolC family protein [Porticoccus sp.]